MRQTGPIAEGEADGRRRASAHGDGPLLVLGAAGTGKSELLARRLADLAAAGAAAERMLPIAPRGGVAAGRRGPARPPLRRSRGGWWGRERQTAPARPPRGGGARSVLRRA